MSRRSSASQKSSPRDPLRLETNNVRMRTLLEQSLYGSQRPTVASPENFSERCGITCGEPVLARSELGVEPYKLQAALIALSRHNGHVVEPITTLYKLGKAGERKVDSPNVHTLTFDPKLQQYLTNAWTRAAERLDNFHGIGNLPVLPELQDWCRGRCMCGQKARTASVRVVCWYRWIASCRRLHVSGIKTVKTSWERSSREPPCLICTARRQSHSSCHGAPGITQSRKLRRRIVNAAAVAIYKRFHFERRRLRQRIIQKRADEGIEPAPEDREYLTHKKPALTTPQKMKRFTAVREKCRADDRHSEQMPAVVSPPAARTPAAATATAASPGSSSDVTCCILQV